MRLIFFLILISTIATSGFAQNEVKDINKPYLKGVAKLESKNYDEAIISFSEALKLMPLNVDILKKRGQAYYRNKNYDKALIDFRNIEMKKPGQGLYNIACCYAYKGEGIKAIETLEKHLKTPYRHPKNKIKLDPAFKEIDESKEWNKLWSKDWHNSYEMKLSDARYALKNKKYNEVFEITDPLLSGSSNRHETYYIRAMALKSQGDFKQALRDLDKAVKGRKDELSYRFERAEVLQKLNKDKRALDDYNYIIEKNPYLPKAYYLRGIVQNKQKAYEAASEDIKLYIQCFPNDVDALYECGKCYFGSESYLEALGYFNKVLANSPSKSHYFKARAETYYKTKTYEYAIRDYTMALDLSPRDGDTYLKRGLSYIEIFNYTKACRDFKRAFELGILDADDLAKQYCK